jgi:hypothetical protein
MPMSERPYTLPEAAAALNHAAFELAVSIAEAFRLPFVADAARRRALVSENLRMAYRQQVEDDRAQYVQPDADDLST